MLCIDYQGQTIALLPEKGLYWQERQTLLLADPHFGKAAAFREHGIPVPAGTTRSDLDRMDRMLERTSARRLVVLGDFFHHRSGRAEHTMAMLETWRERHPSLEILLVRGNHDRHAGDPPEAWGMICVDGPHVDGPFVYCHEPPEQAMPEGCVLAGHLHPSVLLRDPRGGASMRAPCFCLGTRRGLLPAFGRFTGYARIHPQTGDRVFVVGPGMVTEVLTREKGNRGVA